MAPFPTFFAAGNIAGVESGNVTVPLPAGWQKDDVAVLVLMTNLGANIGAPIGWTEMGQQSVTSSASRFFWKRLVDGDTDPVVGATGTTLSATNGLFGRIYVFRGCITTGVPIPDVGCMNTTTPINATNPSAPTIAITYDGSSVAAICVCNGAGGWTSGNPPGGTVGIGGGQSSTAGADCFIDAYWKTAAIPNGQGLGFGVRASAAMYRGIQFSLRPPDPQASQVKLPTVASGTGWTTPNNSLLIDGLATSYSAVTAYGNPLNDSAFGFTIPANATITGISVRVRMRYAARGTEAYCALAQTGQTTVTKPSQSPSTTFNDFTYGAYGDLWGRTWTPDDFNGGTITVQHICRQTSGGGTHYVDFVELTVFYDLIGSISFEFGDSGSVPAEFQAVAPISIDFSTDPFNLSDQRGFVPWALNGASTPAVSGGQLQLTIPTWSGGGQPASGVNSQMTDLSPEAGGVVTAKTVIPAGTAGQGCLVQLGFLVQASAAPAEGGTRHGTVRFYKFANGNRCVDFYYDVNGQVVGTLVVISADTVWLRLTQSGGLMGFSYSTDGSIFTLLGSMVDWPVPKVKPAGVIQLQAVSFVSGLPASAQTVLVDDYAYSGSGRLWWPVYNSRIQQATRVARTVNVQPTGIGPGSSVGQPAVIAGQKIFPNAIGPGSMVGTATVKQSGMIQPGGIGPGSVVGTPRIPKYVLPTGIASTSAIGQPTLYRNDPPPPPAPRAEILWRIILCDANGAAIEDMSPFTFDRKVSYRLNRPAVMTFRVPSDARLINDLAPDGITNLHTIRRVIKGYRSEVNVAGGESYVLRFIGLIWQIEDSGDLDSAWTNVVVMGAFQVLTKRLCVNSAGSESAASFTNMDGGLIVTTMLTKLNQLSYTGIDVGTRDATAARTADFSYLDVASAIAQLTGAFQGFDIELVPLDRKDGHLQTLNIKARKGAYRPQAIFAWGLPPHNVNSVNRLNDAEQYANSVLLLGAPPPVDGALPISASATDADPTETRVFRVMESYPDITNTSYLTALAQEEVAFRRIAREMVGFTPQPGRAPEPFTEYDTGDTVPIYVGTRLRGGFQGIVRVYGFDIELSNEGEERVTALLLSPES